MKNGSYHFNFCKNGNPITDIYLNVGGMHNVENTIAALAVCDLMELDIVKVKDAIANFKGVKRRFEYVVKNDQVVYIDDYAHHPEELKMLISVPKHCLETKRLVWYFNHIFFTYT